MTESCLWLSQKEEKAYFQIRGKGSYKNACLFKDTTQDLLNQGVANFIIDFSQCTGLDSTFLGVLAGLALQSRQLNRQLALVNLENRNFELIQNMGLDSLIVITSSSSDSFDFPSPHSLQGQESTKPETTQTMLDAHETLIKIKESNRQQFQEVIDYLNKSAKKQKETKKQPSTAAT